MSPSPRQQGLFDYAADGRTPNNHAYIDQVDSATDEEDLLSDLDDDVLSDQFDDLRVEDEDWEIAERGLSFFSPPLVLRLTRRFFLFPFGRLHQTVQSPASARRCTIPKRLGENDPDVPDKIHRCPAPRHQPTNNDKHRHRSTEERQDH